MTGWFSLLGDEPCQPVGHVLPGVVIDNISKDDEWIESESSVYMGQRVWRRLRKAESDLFRHFSVMSPPSSNMDSVLMAWQVRDQAKSIQ